MGLRLFSHVNLPETNGQICRTRAFILRRLQIHPTCIFVLRG